MTSIAQRHTALLDLPPELLESIMKELPAKSRARVGVTSKQLRTVTAVPIGYQKMIDELINWAKQFVIKDKINNSDSNIYRGIIQRFYKQVGQAIMIVDLLKEGTNLYYKVNLIRTIPFGELVNEDHLKKIQKLLDTTEVADLNIVILSAYKARVDKEREALLVYKVDVDNLLSSLKK